MVRSLHQRAPVVLCKTKGAHPTKMKSAVVLFITLFQIGICQLGYSSEPEQVPKDLLPTSEVAGVPPPGHPLLPPDCPIVRPVYRCFADNPDTIVFTAIDFDANVAQDTAMLKCFRVPPSQCRPLGCRSELP